MLNELSNPDVQKSLDMAKSEAGGDVNKIMELIIPKIYEIQGKVMSDYGFEASDDGFADYANFLKQHEDHDEVKELALTFKVNISIE